MCPRALSRHFVWTATAFRMCNFKVPKQILEGLSTEIHPKYFRDPLVPRVKFHKVPIGSPGSPGPHEPVVCWVQGWGQLHNINSNSNSNSRGFNSNSNSNSGQSPEYQLQLQLQLRRFQLQLQFQLQQISRISTPTPTPTPEVSTPTPIPTPEISTPIPTPFQIQSILFN